MFDLRFLAIAVTVFFGLTVPFGSVNLNPERVLYPLIVIFLFKQLVSSRLVSVTGVIDYTAFILSTLFSTMLSSDFFLHVPGLLIYTIPFTFFLMFGMQESNAQAVDRSAPFCLFICELFLLLTYLGLIPSDVMFDDLGRLQLFMFEPNILGAVIGAFFFLSIPCCGSSLFKLIVVVIAPIMIILSFSKAPYVAYLVCLCFYFFKSANVAISGNTRLLVAGLLFISILASLVLSSNSIAEIYVGSFAREDAITTRLVLFNFAWSRFLEHPFFGNGPLDIALTAPELMTLFGADTIRSVWIGQIFLSLLHDTGIIGFAFYIRILWMLLKKSYFTIVPTSYSNRLLCYFCAFCMLIFCSQATTTHLNAIFGVVAGLLASETARMTRLKGRIKQARDAALLEQSGLDNLNAKQIRQ